jgi:diguanylate cyclase (GGDEF)-like protein
VNDRFGHPTGDEVLRAVATTLRDAVRQVDTAARWGGEEFAVVLPSTDVDGAAQLAERLRAALAAHDVVGPDGQTLRVTASFGVASSLPGSTPERLVETADDALYRAKRAGKNRVYAGSVAVTSL